MKRTQKQVDAEIAALREIKPKVLQRSLFGDNHHAAIDAQVSVLKDYLSEDDILDFNWPDNVCDAALEALDWLYGESEFDSLVNEWKELVRP